MKFVLKKKMELYRETKGTINKMANEGDKANQSRAEDCDLKNMIAKYGIMPFELQNQASENLFLDMRGTDITMGERLKQREKINEYFEQLPAVVRKNYADNPEQFYQLIMSGDYTQLLKDNVFNQEQVNQFNEIRNAKQKQIDDLQMQLQQAKNDLEQMRGELNNASKENGNLGKEGI